MSKTNVMSLALALCMTSLNPATLIAEADGKNARISQATRPTICRGFDQDVPLNENGQLNNIDPDSFIRGVEIQLRPGRGATVVLYKFRASDNFLGTDGSFIKDNQVYAEKIPFAVSKPDEIVLGKLLEIAPLGVLSGKGEDREFNGLDGPVGGLHLAMRCDHLR